ncbi:helix-turn-helix domain-containing protein [Streptomyces sp. NPDC058239]|uniref:helix-turn-helix domain-containing protein n=1 Tax=Streptomyces sp. NPDC058239 TaxID=3346395 RepID=UPI0036F0D6B7
MAQRPNELTPEAGPWHRWGCDLRKAREARGMSLSGLSARVTYNASYLAKFERAERPVPRHAAVALDAALDVCGVLLRGWDVAAQEAGVGTQAPRVHVASLPGHVASGMDTLAFPGPQQAGSPGDDTDTLVVPCRTPEGIRFVPVPRRAVLASGLVGLAAVSLPVPAFAAPYSPVGSSAPTPIEHFAQVRRVLIQTDNLMGPRTVLPAITQKLGELTVRRRNARGRDADRLLELETRFEELAGWLSQDIGDERAAYAHTARALDDSHIAGDTELTAYILGRKAQLAADMGHRSDALGLATAARRTAPTGSRLEVIAVMHQAHGHSLLGEKLEALRGYDEALLLLDRADRDGVWGSWLDAAYIHTARARSLADLGYHEQAVTGFRDALEALPAGYRRDRGVYLARAARSHAGVGDIEQAAVVGLEAVQIAAETSSARIIDQLGLLDVTLAATPSTEGVREFRSAFDRILYHPAQ